MGFGDGFDLGRAARELAEYASSLEPKAHTPAQCRAIADSALRIERAAKALRLKVSDQAAAGEEWRRLGFACVEDWLAHRNGTTTAQAVREAKLADDLSKAPSTAEALVRGDISAEQAAVVADAAQAAPGAEAGLLASAPGLPLDRLKRAAERAKATARSAEEEAERQARIHRSRHLRTWVGPDGAFEGRLRLTKGAGAVLNAALEPYLAKAYEAARAEGRHEGRDAYLADALVAMATDKAGGGKGPRPVINVRVDYPVLRQGYPEEGEMCEIEGLGSVPLSLVMDMAKDAVLNVVLTNGRDVLVAARARSATPLQRLVLAQRADSSCEVRTCTRRLGLEVDHVIPWAEGGPTAVGNEMLGCTWHHYLKTHRGFAYRRADDGLWDVVAPEDGDPEPDPPPGWDSG